MKVVIKNNRLQLENQTDSLADVSIDRLREIAASYQIGVNRVVAKPQSIQSGGRIIEREIETLEPKSRSQLEKEIRDRISIRINIPRELWTEEQERAFSENGLYDEQDIKREEEVKKEAGILIILPPYETTKDKYKEALMLATVTEKQWEFIKELTNYKVNNLYDEDGKKEGVKKSYAQRILEVESIPESPEDEERLAAKLEAKRKAKEYAAKSKRGFTAKVEEETEE